jgi:hypothetical protein
MKVIEENPDKPWDWELISRNITTEVIEKNPDKQWDWQLKNIA